MFNMKVFVSQSNTGILIRKVEVPLPGWLYLESSQSLPSPELAIKNCLAGIITAILFYIAIFSYNTPDVIPHWPLWHEDWRLQDEGGRHWCTEGNRNLDWWVSPVCKPAALCSLTASHWRSPLGDLEWKARAAFLILQKIDFYRQVIWTDTLIN